MRSKFYIILLFSFFQSLLLNSAPFVVVIDAGHGGKDPGAINRSRTLREKDINLAVALNLGDLIKKNHDDVKVIYTRSTDVFVELYERATIANKAKADLFISIHTNAAKSRSAYGTETYTLGLGGSAANLEVAKRENSVILLEEDFSTRYEGFDPNSPESYIIFEFIQDKHLEQSVNLASDIQEAFSQKLDRADRGVRQAGFLVLKATGMPSVLVELGYISNESEERFLSSSTSQKQMAQSIYSAFAKYKSTLDRKQKKTMELSQNVAVTDKVDKQSVQPKSDSVSTTSSPTKGKDNTKSVDKKPAASNEIVYKIQLCISPKPLSANSPSFKGFKPVSSFKEKGYYKYTYLESTDKEFITDKLKEVRKKIADAYIIKFQNGKKL